MNEMEQHIREIRELGLGQEADALCSALEDGNLTWAWIAPALQLFIRRIARLAAAERRLDELERRVRRLDVAMDDPQGPAR